MIHSKIIDFHTHCFPDKLAERAMDKLSYSGGGLKYYTSGTIDGLKKSMSEEGVTSSVVLNIATNERQQRSVNDFAAEINNEDDIFAFGSVYPLGESAMDELERIKALGLKGVKLHPEYQGFFADDERLKPIYEKISRLGLITVFHSGLDLAYKPPFKCMPENLARALKWFSAPVVAAHWGASCYSYEVADVLCGLDVYFDTSFGYGNMTKDAAYQIIEKHGTDKILFGTDSPWSIARREMRLLNSLDLSDNDMEKILFRNAEKLLGI